MDKQRRHKDSPSTSLGTRIKGLAFSALLRAIDFLTRERSDNQQGMSMLHKVVYDHHEFLARKRLGRKRVALLSLLGEDRIHYCDIGARGGAPAYLLPFSSHMRVSLFEPNPSEFALLDESFGEALVDRYRCGVGNPSDNKLHVTKSSGLTSVLEPYGAGWSVMRGDDLSTVRNKLVPTGTETIRLAPLETLIDVQEKPIDILKVDVQGYEYEVLSGLGAHRPMLIQCEVSAVEIYKGQRTMGSVISQLESLGYFPAIFMPPKNFCHLSGDFRRASYRFHGDIIFVPDYGAKGSQIITRQPMFWRFALELWGLTDLARHMHPKYFS